MQNQQMEWFMELCQLILDGLFMDFKINFEVDQCLKKYVKQKPLTLIIWEDKISFWKEY